MFGEALLGSVASALIEKSRLPVLILPLEVFEDEGAEQCRVVRTDLCTHMLHPTDFSDVAERANANESFAAARASFKLSTLRCTFGIGREHVVQR